MADLKSIGKAIGRVATNYLEAQAKKVSNHVEKEEKTKYDTLASNLNKLRQTVDKVHDKCRGFFSY